MQFYRTIRKVIPCWSVNLRSEYWSLKLYRPFRTAQIESATIIRLGVLVLAVLQYAIPTQAASLQVTENGRFLQYADGKPFFYLGDTAWQLFHRLNREEVDHYLEDRASKGFTVIQAVALAELDGLNTPNPYGHRPLIDNDPTRPDVNDGPQNDYWDHVDYVVEQAASLGMFIGMLPTWGSHWMQGGIFTEENARVYGEWIGERYRDRPIIWILGGDRNIRSERDRSIIDAMAEGLRASIGNAQLITYHPMGPGRSSDYFHEAEWLDFNMHQSSHAARDHDNGLFTELDFTLNPPKPTLDAEPRYESIMVGFYNAGVNRHLVFDDYDVRQAAYWSLLAGACGHTYGNNSIWQMWSPEHRPAIQAVVHWKQALNHPGAFQMGHLRRLFESRPFQQLIPDDSIILDGPRHGGAKIRAARAQDGSFAFIYSPRGEPFSVAMGVIESQSVNATWYDPRYGIAFHLHRSDNAGVQTFVPPSSGRGCDWVLVLDDANAGFPLAGQIDFGGM